MCIQSRVRKLNLTSNRETMSINTLSLGRAEVLSNKQLLSIEANSNISETTRKGVEKIHEVVENCRHISQVSEQRTSQSLEEITGRMHDLAGLSTEQSKTLNAIIELLKQQSPVEAQQQTTESGLNGVTEVTQDAEQETEAPDLLEDEGLQDSLNRLCRLANEKERTVFSTDAESIILDIEQLLMPFANSNEGANDYTNQSKRRRASYENDVSNDCDMQQHHVVKRIKGHLATSRSLAVNEEGIFPTP